MQLYYLIIYAILFLVIIMHVIGVVCEYNPMHLGHLYQIKRIKEMYKDSILIIVTCGSFSQRGEPCIINKWDKTKIALNNDIDLVIELPFVYATQSADIFAEGSIKLLNYLKIDTLVFGSESDDIVKFKEIAKTQLKNKEYNNLVKKYLDTGINYPTAMSKALEEILGYTVNEPNDLLAISYIKEILRNNYNIDCVSIKRTNDYHARDISNDNIINASLIREMFNDGKDISKYIIPNSDKYFYKNISFDNYFDYLRILIINNDLEKIQTVDEGIHNKLKKEIINCSNYNDLILKIKSKRYTYNKINRMLLHILTNFTKEEASNKSIDYIRLLGFSREGQKYLNSIKKDISVPIITNYKKNISNVLDLEYRITYIYSLIVKDHNVIINEYMHKPVIKDN